MDEATTRIYRPRQVYIGPTEQHYVPIEKRGKRS
jgi:citrate synthase